MSFALRAAGLLKTPLDSGSFMSWGLRRQGRLDHGLHEPRATPTPSSPGLRLDTSTAGVSRVGKVARSALESGPRWRPVLRSPRGFVRRHPLSF